MLAEHLNESDIMERIFLLPGDYGISNEPVLLETLVGSCVSVCLFNLKSGHAAMNHFLQDIPPDDGNCEPGRFGVSATTYIIESLMQYDPNPRHYCAQIFGGAAVIKSIDSEGNIGQKNIAVARKVLSEYQIRIIREEVAGTRGRRVKFDTSTNTVFCRFAGDIARNLHQI